MYYVSTLLISLQLYYLIKMYCVPLNLQKNIFSCIQYAIGHSRHISSAWSLFLHSVIFSNQFCSSVRPRSPTCRKISYTPPFDVCNCIHIASLCLHRGHLDACPAHRAGEGRGSERRGISRCSARGVRSKASRVAQETEKGVRDRRVICCHLRRTHLLLATAC